MNPIHNEPHSIGSELDLFLKHIESLKEVLPITMLALHTTGRSARKNLEDFVEKHANTDDSQSPRRLTIPAPHTRKFFKVKSRSENFELANTLIPRSIFVALVSQYDAYLGRLLRSLVNSKPELLNPSDKTFTFAEAIAFPSILAIRDHVIEKEIESFLRLSHLEHFKWMEKRFNVPLTKDLLILPKFIELTERRNLFVHADGLVSSNYISVCKSAGVNLSAEIIEGYQLVVSHPYFEESVSCLQVLGIMLAHVLWRKILPDDRQKADQNLIETAYWLIDKSDYTSAIMLLDFVCTSFKVFHGDWYKSALILNRAQAYKWQGNSAKCLEILKAHDWSALEDSLKLGNSVLTEDWDSSVEIMRRIGSNGVVKSSDYEDWPIFSNFRSTPEFLAAYQEIFGGEFSIKVKSANAEPPIN